MDCCYLVGTLGIDPLCITSIQVQGSTEATLIEGTLLQGPTIGSVSISGYATDAIHTGCPGRAGVSIEWMRKYDCDTDTIYLIFNGAGRSYIYGDVGGLASLYMTLPVSYEIINASSLNGPTTLYEKSSQTDGYGLNYTGGPLSFSATEGGVASFSVGTYSDLYLQSFSLQTSPGAFPVANYNFIYLPAGGIAG